MLHSLSPLRLTIALFLLSGACGTTQRAAPREPARAAVAPARTDGLYAADEAVRDALSGRLEYLGTGAWTGDNRTRACVFRNQRVLVVNAYCSPTEAPAFRLDVYSPERGRVRIYAEASGPVSARTRPEYFTFTAESEPAAGAEARLPALTLAMSFAELRAYDEQRYGAFLPACFGGQEHGRAKQGCLGPLAPRAAAWTAQNRVFLERASDDWYRVVRELRALSVLHGQEPK